MGRIKVLVTFGSAFLASAVLFQNCGKFNTSKNSSAEQSSTSQFGNSSSNGTASTGAGGNGQESLVVTVSQLTQTVKAGSTLSLTATAVDSEGKQVSYVWTLNGNPVGSNSPTLTIDNVPTSFDGAKIAVTGSTSSAGVSAKANLSLTVTVPIYATGDASDYTGVRTSSCLASDPATGLPCGSSGKFIAYQVFVTASAANSIALHNCGGFPNAVGTYCDTGWTDRGIVGYISPSHFTGAVPIYKCTGSNPGWVWPISPSDPAQASGCTVFGWAPGP